MTAGERVVAAARATVGSRFRLHGRDPAYGLDCIGVVAVALHGGGFAGEVPGGYALRGGREAEVTARLDAVLVRVPAADAGDVLLVRAGPGQLHMGIWTGVGLVHADAGLRRVVERPGVPEWPTIGCWRLGEA